MGDNLHDWFFKIYLIISIIRHKGLFMGDYIPYVTADLKKRGLYMDIKTGNLAWIKRRRFRQVWNGKKQRLEHGHWYSIEMPNGQQGVNVFIKKSFERRLVFIGSV